MVSLGTGLIPVTELKEIDVFRPDSIWDTAKLAYGISAIGEYTIIFILVIFFKRFSIDATLPYLKLRL